MEQLACFAIRRAAPEAKWRSTIMSGLIASRFFSVSKRVSPFVMLLADADMFIVSAESLLPAISNEVRVRVLDSRNRLIMVLPRSVGTFLILRNDFF